ncbi:MAG: hypothetical protein ACJ72Z_11865 [Pyrinomonadaceae bacterium]
MRSSRFAVLAVFVCAVLFTTNCSFYSRIMARKNLVDGSIAYKDRKFAEAEELFRKAASRDPEGATLEGRTAQLFLARTLHSRFIGDRQNKELAEQAIAEYKKAVPQVKHEYAEAKSAYDANKSGNAEQKRFYAALSSLNSTVSAIPNLIEGLGDRDQAIKFQTDTAADTQMPETARARALVSLGLEYNTCANDITDTEKTKKTVKKDGKDVFQFVKPENPEDLAKLKECVAKGQEYFNPTQALEPEAVKNAASANIKAMNDDELKVFEEILSPFDSARSYRASIAVQASRLAEMEGSPDYANLKADADAKRAAADELKKVVKALEEEKEARVTAEQEAVNANKANANASAPK